jgi:hypothetical protein
MKTLIAIGAVFPLLFGAVEANASTADQWTVKSSQPDSVSAGDRVDVSPVWTLEPESEWAPSTSALSALNGHIYFSSTGFKIDATQETLA